MKHRYNNHTDLLVWDLTDNRHASTLVHQRMHSELINATRNGHSIHKDSDAIRAERYGRHSTAHASTPVHDLTTSTENQALMVLREAIRIAADHDNQ